jgi:ribokinase
MGADVVVLGIFVADLAFSAPRLPVMGETILGRGFRMGPGGKGSNQTVAAAKAGGDVAFVTRIGRDAFGEIAVKAWREAGISEANLAHVARDETRPTGAAFIFVSTEDGDNAIIVEPGAAGAIAVADVEAAQGLIAGAKVFVTQLEQPVAAAEAGLAIARAAGVRTVLNPAPAAPLPDSLLALCDFATPNETEAAALTGLPVTTLDEARAAGDALRRRGVGAAVITLGAQGALYHAEGVSELVPALRLGPVVDTTGAGDAFTGGFAVALAEGRSPLDAVRFACTTASISVTRPGTAPAMPSRAEIEAALKG